MFNKNKVNVHDWSTFYDSCYFNPIILFKIYQTICFHLDGMRKESIRKCELAYKSRNNVQKVTRSLLSLLKFTHMKLFSNCVSRIKRPAHFQQSMKSVLEVVLLT